MENPTRVRLVFEDRRLLSKPQRRDGLLQCWIQIHPNVATVSDLAAHITSSFGLSCPNGLILSVHGFVLPSFESASIVKDEDIVSVRQRGVLVKEVVHICDRVYNMEDCGIIVKNPVYTEGKCLALAKVQEVSGDYRGSSLSEEANSRKKKRKREISEEETNYDEEINPASEKNVFCSPKGVNLKGSLRNGRKAFALSIDKTTTHVDGSYMDGFSAGKERKMKWKPDTPEETTNSDVRINSDLEKHEFGSQKGDNSRKNLERKVKAFPHDIDKTTMNTDGGDMHGLSAGKERKMKRKPDMPQKETNPDEGINSGSEKREFGSQNGVSSRKKVHRKQKVFTLDIDKTTRKTDGGDMHGLSAGKERCNAVEADSQRDADATPCGTKKFPSRSARRKKAKREWMRNLAKSQKEQDQNHLPPDGHDSFNCKENVKNIKCQETVESGQYKEKQQIMKHHVTSDTLEEEIVPVVIRPGHLRFVTLDEHSDEEMRPEVENLVWHGPTNKKKGQKWGLEKLSSMGCIDSDFNKVHDENVVDEDKQVINFEGSFEELMPLTREPKEADVIAYRLVELSSSWCPELSPFRVGTIKSYDNISKKVSIIPLPQYSNISVENEEESTCQPQISLYAEDGSLEIDLASLVDVRLFEMKEAEGAMTNAQENVAAADTEHESNSDLALSKCDVISAITSASGWEEVRQELEERKCQIISSNGSSCPAENKSSSGKWPFKARKGSGLGCTMALLRAQHDLQE